MRHRVLVFSVLLGCAAAPPLSFPRPREAPPPEGAPDASGSVTAPSPTPAPTPTPGVIGGSGDVHSRLAAMTPADMNLILITVDSLRWDLHFAGNPREMSPSLDALAAQGVVFDRGYALSSYTGRSVGPLLVGRYPSECPNDNMHFTAYDDSNVFLAERLAAAGFVTLGTASHRYFRRSVGLLQGIEHWDSSGSHSTDTLATDDRVADNAIRLLERNAHTGRRFFLWAHMIDPHADYLPHEGQPVFGAELRDRYDSEVMFTDRQIGRLMAAIDGMPEANRTVVVATTDHGELFHEHGISRHGRELWENLMHVPWIVRVPGIPPHHVLPRRSHIDLVPTLLELMRVVPSDPEVLQGQSLAGDLVGQSEPARTIFMDLPWGPSNDPRRGLILGDWKLIVRRGERRELYHLSEDPDELRELSSAQPDELQRLERELGRITQGFTGPWRRSDIPGIDPVVLP